MIVVNEERLKEWEDSCKEDELTKVYVNYAKQWADRIELKLEGGKSLDQALQESDIEAALEGHTGLMYDCAIHFLPDVWKYGKEFKKFQEEKNQR